VSRHPTDCSPSRNLPQNPVAPRPTVGHTEPMQVLLDGRVLSIERPSLAEGLRAAIADAQSLGRIVVEVVADGVRMTDDAITSATDAPSAISELRVSSADPVALVRVSVLDAADALEVARAEQAAAAELIQAGRVEDALQHLQVALSTWQAVRDVLQRGAAVLALNLSEIKPRLDDGETSFTAASADLTKHLNEVKRALADLDWSALSDVVGYDLDAQVGVWKQLLSSFAASLPGPRTGNPT